MCGIIALTSNEAGRFDRMRDPREASSSSSSSSPSSSSSRIDSALDVLGRRGPDGRGVWVSPDGRAILGHTRLAIVDVERGAQPILNEDGSRVLVFNGEIYGHAELRMELEAKGHHFRSRCDAEIALHLYEEVGPAAMLARLRGEYAFAIWDARDRLLFAARDRFGVKPLLYAEHDGMLHVASQAKALFAAGVPARWDDASFFQAASLQYTLPDTTLFSGIRVLPPGHFLLAHDGHVRIKRYWDLDYPIERDNDHHSGPPRSPDIETAASALRECLEEAVRVRLVADVPVAFQLSGGIDSSAVLALAARSLTQAADAFTVSFTDDARYDELAIATEMAAKVGARLHVVRADSARLASELPLAIADGEGLAVNAHIAAKRLLARAVHDAGFKVVLTGEGADEVLAGYAHLRADLDDAHTKTNLAAANIVSAGLMLPDSGAALDTSSIARAIGFVPTWLRAKATLGRRVHDLLREDWLASFGQRDPFNVLIAQVDVAGQLHGRGRVEQALYLWSKLALEGYILRTLGDGMEMSSSIEGRVPFLDHRLFELIRTFPTHFKIDARGIEKAVLRAAVGSLLTERLRSRSKHPFLAPPLLASARGVLPPLVDDLLRGPNVAPFFDRTKLTRLLDRLPSMTTEERIATEPALMIALSAAVLHNHYRL